MANYLVEAQLLVTLVLFVAAFSSVLLQNEGN